MTNNKQQTAVDLFHDKVNELIIGKKTITSNDLGKIWIQAKEIEKEQTRLYIKEKWVKYRQFTKKDDAWLFKEFLLEITYGGNK